MMSLNCLRALAPQLGLLVLLPDRTTGRTDLAGGLALEVQTTSLLTRGSDTTHLTVLLGRVADPVHLGGVTDGLVHRVNHDHLEPLVDGILADPVGVQHTQGTDLATDTLLSDGLQVAGSLDLGHTGSGRLAVADALGDLPLAATTLHANAEDGHTLLGLVAQAARCKMLFKKSRFVSDMDITNKLRVHGGQSRAVRN